MQQAVSTRIMDFDLPEEWFENPDLFFGKDYPTKLAMIQEMMRKNMGTKNRIAWKRGLIMVKRDTFATMNGWITHG